MGAPLGISKKSLGKKGAWNRIFWEIRRSTKECQRCGC